MRWQVTFEDRRGIKTVYRELFANRDGALATALVRYIEAHPDMGTYGEDYWIHRVEDLDQPDITGVPT